ncbi:MAG: hypothetical protein J1F23_05415 [Oscillospiraceae bacterium]|nr:hypothetical protein [Oscillospiraceae bacterium]
MSQVHEKWIVDFLNNNTESSYIGSELKKFLIDEFPTLKEANARKVISDCIKKGIIKSTAPIKFGNNEFVYYSVQAKNRFELFKHNIKKYKPKLHSAIFALKRNSGIISYNELCKITGAYENENLHDVNINSLLNDLNVLNIAELKEFNGIKFLVFKNHIFTEERINNVVEDLKDKNLVLYQSLLWMSRNNIISSNKQLYFGEGNNYNGVQNNDTVWDAFCYTNTVGLGDQTKEFQTIAVVDFLHKHKYEEYDFSGFKSRVDHLLYSVKGEKRKVLPIIIATDFSPVARALINKNNYMCFDLDSLLGKNAFGIARKYQKSIKEIREKIKNHKEDEIQDNIYEFCNYLHDNKTEINYQNLKGDLFEYLMYPVFTKIFDKRNDHITHSFSKSVDGKKFECDYRIETESENIFVELKGYKKDYIIPLGGYDQEKKKIASNQCVKWFLCETYENAKKAVGQERKPSFCYITTASISDEAKEALKDRKKDKPNDLESYYEREGLIELLNKYGFKKEVKIIENYFI